LVAGLTAETVMRNLGHGRAILLGLGTSAAGMLLFGLSPWLQLSVAAMPLIGGGFVLYSAASLTLIQALAPAEGRGRLTALFALLYWGLMPIGGLLGGIVAEAAGAQTAFALAGSSCSSRESWRSCCGASSSRCASTVMERRSRMESSSIWRRSPAARSR